MRPEDYAIVPDQIEGPKRAQRQGFTAGELAVAVEADRIRFLRERARHLVQSWRDQGHRPRKTAEEEVFQKLKAEYLENRRKNEERRARQEAARIQREQARLEAIELREAEIESALQSAAADELREVVRAQRAFIKSLIDSGKIRAFDIPADLQ